ncbi:Pentatricopeptide repeat-containing protein, mitochondrial [Glycine soja]|nr:Pentatricopeptide repeat-containing protein, mitochondrial [Glycine soja]
MAFFTRRLLTTVAPTCSSPSNQIKTFLSKGLYHQTLQLFSELHLCGHSSISFFLPSVIKASSSAQCHAFGTQLHCLALKTGSHSETVVSNSIITMYFKFSDVGSARQVFDTMPHRDPITWNSLINGYLHNGYLEEALEALNDAYLLGLVPKPELLASVVSMCGRRMGSKIGRQIHALVVVNERIGQSMFLSTALVDFYFRCGDSLMALRVFDGMEVKNVVSWTTMISGCIAHQDYDEAFACFRAMQAEGVCPNRVTSIALLSACAEPGFVKHGKEIHGYAFRHGISVGNALINMYAKCGCLNGSRKMFLEMPNRDNVTWSSLISAYGLHGCGEQALQIFNEMNERGVKPDAITFLAVLSACNHAGLVAEGQRIFKQVRADCEIPLTIEHYACLVDLLGRSGKLEYALEIRRTMPMKPSARIWSSLVSACKLHGRLDIAEMLAPQLIRSEPNNAAKTGLRSNIYLNM